MSKKRSICFLDIQQLLKLDEGLNYFSICPACKEQVGDHKDTDFLRAQMAEHTAREDPEEEVAMVDAEGEEGGGDTRHTRKKVKLPLPAAEAVALIKKVCETDRHDRQIETYTD
jgi:hypothetical protein